MGLCMHMASCKVEWLHSCSLHVYIPLLLPQSALCTGAENNFIYKIEMVVTPDFVSCAHNDVCLWCGRTNVR